MELIQTLIIGLPNWGREILDFLAVGTAVYSTVRGRLGSKLWSYIVQSLILVFIALLLTPSDSGFLAASFILLVRIAAIRPLIARATLGANERENVKPAESTQPEQQKPWWLRPKDWLLGSQSVQRAKPYWMEYGRPRTSTVWSLFACTLMIGVGYLVAYRVAEKISQNQLYIVGLGASLSLMLIGLFAMINERDMSSQIVGLLVMENGLFLAAAVAITSVTTILYFFITMVAYFLITLAVLAVFVPRVQEYSGSALVEEQHTLKDKVIVPSKGEAHD